MKAVCRPAIDADVQGIYEVEKTSFTSPWSYESFRMDICENETAHYFVAEEDSRIVGFCGLHAVLDEGHIMNVAVLPEYRHLGIGEALLRCMLEHTHLDQYTLEVRVSNTAAINLYTKLGFAGVGIRPGYYGNEDALIMWSMENLP